MRKTKHHGSPRRCGNWSSRWQSILELVSGETKRLADNPGEQINYVENVVWAQKNSEAPVDRFQSKIKSRWLPLPVNNHDIAAYNWLKYFAHGIQEENFTCAWGSIMQLLIQLEEKRGRIETGRESMGATQHGRLIWSHDMTLATGSCYIQQVHPSHKSNMQVRHLRNPVLVGDGDCVSSPTGRY